MSYSQSNFISANAEFMALCQAQISLLTQGLGAAWIAIYLTEGLWDDSSQKLIPVAIYPPRNFRDNNDQDFVILPNDWEIETIEQKALGSSLELGDGRRSEISKYLNKRYKVVLPLMYENMIMGVLVTGRKDRNWSKKELTQIEEIAKTLAIARLLDQRQVWYQQQLNEQLQLQRIQRDRLDTLLHQLKNPLTALRTFGKLLFKRLFPEDRNYAVAQGILRESDRLQELLQQFDLEIDQLETEVISPVILGSTNLSLPPNYSESSSLFLLPGNSLNLESINLKDILAPLIDSCQAIAEEKNIKLVANLTQNLPLVKGNNKALREVFNNLLDNAIKYTPEGGNILVKSVNNASEKEIQGIAIIDSGYGIPTQDQIHLFERHYRGVQAEGNIPGTGLGLAIVKDLLEQMQAKIEVISPNDNHKIFNSKAPGTTFIVWLKIA